MDTSNHSSNTAIHASERVRVRRGEIYSAQLDPAIGHEQRGMRPVLVIQNDTGNQNSGTTIVAAITSRGKPHIPTHVLLYGATGVSDGSCVMLEQIRTLDVSRIRQRLGRVSAAQMRSIDMALAVSLGIKGIHDNFMVLALCPACRKAFQDMNDYLVVRADFEQRHREPCTLCNIRTGYDFKVMRK